LSGNDNIRNEAYALCCEQNNLFWKMLKLFVALININLLPLRNTYNMF